MGVLYGVAGVLITSRLGAATPSSGQLPGTRRDRGRRHRRHVAARRRREVAGAMVGAVLLATIDNGMSILNVSSFIQIVDQGAVVLVVALAFDAYMINHRRYRR